MIGTEGMFSTIACITNFMMQFLDNEEILGFTIIIFRRLYNFFPHYRKHLEDPIVIILIQVLKIYKNALTQSNKGIHDPVKELQIRLFERS